MKKIITIFISLILILALFAIPCFAEAVDDTSSENAAVSEGEKFAQEDAKNFYDEFIAEVSSVANWAELGILLSGIIALIAAIRKSIKPISAAIAFIKDKTAKSDDVNKAVDTAVNKVRDEYKKERLAILERMDSIQASEDRLTTILTLALTSMKINPTAKAEIMNMITGAKKVTGTVDEIVSTVQGAIAAAEAQTEKIETPALDSIIESTAKIDEPAGAEPVYISLGG